MLNNTKLRHFWAHIVNWAPRHARKTFIVLARGVGRKRFLSTKRRFVALLSFFKPHSANRIAGLIIERNKCLQAILGNRNDKGFLDILCLCMCIWINDNGINGLTCHGLYSKNLVDTWYAWVVLLDYDLFQSVLNNARSVLISSRPVVKYTFHFTVTDEDNDLHLTFSTHTKTFRSLHIYYNDLILIGGCWLRQS